MPFPRQGVGLEPYTSNVVEVLVDFLELIKLKIDIKKEKRL